MPPNFANAVARMPFLEPLHDAAQTTRKRAAEARAYPSPAKRSAGGAGDGHCRRRDVVRCLCSHHRRPPLCAPFPQNNSAAIYRQHMNEMWLVTEMSLGTPKCDSIPRKPGQVIDPQPV
ncbi:uncharacterized protein Tco025E_00859 [Trypanosoma conorhini]|uniref:Uncharacterized protein n=1 Tax=Trypanosoma conorhini TaxID=83891 RepID=A0A422QA96_9TRYP|nr:uncharacterized protein Tco025E_00859 [Trypanosoma conorhini]RNF26896.1 hypothetical protein Tco025E_00859 [Trypanosoma conorhini]